MLKLIKDVLKERKDISGWKINQKSIISTEVFFIKNEIEMNRAKVVDHYQLTVYKDFSEDGVKYRGSSTISLYPTMNEAELKKEIADACLGAQYVKNQFYPLVKPTEVKKTTRDKENLSSQLNEITTEILQNSEIEGAWLNSAELFLNQVDRGIINSNGVNVNYPSHVGELVFITNAGNVGDEIELYKKINFSEYIPGQITKEIKKMLKISRERAVARPTSSLTDYNIILTGEPVKEFLEYFYHQANAQLVYENISSAKIDQFIQGDKISGDKITMLLDPFLAGSTESGPYDGDGYPLEPIEIIDEGKLKNYWGNNRFSSYLGVKPTGNIPNLVVETGSKPLKALKNEPYLELLAFSSFQMDPLTGDFGGEIRLGRYFDGEETIAVTGGSISGNIKDVQQEMHFTKERQQLNNFVGPLSIKLKNISVAGS